jgi:hypothetical protein
MSNIFAKTFVVPALAGRLGSRRFRLKPGLRTVKLLGVALVLAAGSSLLFSQDTGPQAEKGAQTFSPPPEWRPTHLPAGEKYVGNRACAECHTQGNTQHSTPMGRALETAAESRILRAHPRLTFKSGPYTYTIAREGGQSVYAVTDGRETITAPVLYAFGQGKAGQTYVFEHGGQYYESRVSFYEDIKGLDYTLGAPREAARSLAEAAGRAMDKADVNDCFSCHATGAVSAGKIQLDKMTLGVTCEGCHGPGEKHVAAMKTKASGRTQNYILNPGRFDTHSQSEFCGACHRTWAQVQAMRLQGVGNVRFQPYRIFNSKCYDFEDKRISCAACHDPHTEMQQDAAFYDAKCLACHQPKARPVAGKGKASACKVESRNCASCHMPKYELEGAHFKFTDHNIRVARPGEAYPN